MVCLAIRGFAEADRKPSLTQPGESGARGVRLPAGKFDKLVERGALRGCDGIQHTAQFACRALLVSSGCGGGDRCACGQRLRHLLQLDTEDAPGFRLGKGCGLLNLFLCPGGPDGAAHRDDPRTAVRLVQQFI